MIPHDWMNEWFEGLAKLTEKITGRKVNIPHKFEKFERFDAKKIKENYEEIIKAYEEEKGKEVKGNG